MTLDEFEAITNAATTGPYVVATPPVGTIYVPKIMTEDGGILAETTHHGNMLADATFFAACRAMVPKMIKVVKAVNRLGGCLAEFEPDYTDACSEHWDAVWDLMDQLEKKTENRS